MTPVPYEHVTQWDVGKVASWLEEAGFGTFAAEFEENGITGDVLVELDRYTLKDVGITSVGRRVMLLKAIQGLREQHGMPNDGGNMTPTADSPAHSEASIFSPMQTLSPQASPVVGDEYKRIRRAIVDRDTQIQKLAQEVERLSTHTFGTTSDREQVATLLPMPATMPRKGSAPVRQAELDRSASTVRSVKAVTRMRLGSENHDYRRVEQSLPLCLVAAAAAGGGGGGGRFRPRFQSMPISTAKAPPGACGGGGDDTSSSSAGVPSPCSRKGPAAEQRSCAAGSSQNFRIRRDDRCFEVLPAVLRNCRVDDDWRNYTLYIAYGATAQRRERLIDHEEKVYPIMCTLKGENPVFVVKRTDDVHPKAVNGRWQTDPLKERQCNYR